jgi:hypothetical protein
VHHNPQKTTDTAWEKRVQSISCAWAQINVIRICYQVSQDIYAQKFRKGQKNLNTHFYSIFDRFAGFDRSRAKHKTKVCHP